MKTAQIRVPDQTNTWGDFAGIIGDHGRLGEGYKKIAGKIINTQGKKYSTSGLVVEAQLDDERIAFLKEEWDLDVIVPQPVKTFTYGNVDRSFRPPHYEFRDGKVFTFKKIHYSGTEYDGDGDWMVVAHYVETEETPEQANADRLAEIENVKRHPDATETATFYRLSTGDLSAPEWLRPIASSIDHLAIHILRPYDTATTWDDPACYSNVPVTAIFNHLEKTLKEVYP